MTKKRRVGGWLECAWVMQFWRRPRYAQRASPSLIRARFRSFVSSGPLLLPHSPSPVCVSRQCLFVCSTQSSVGCCLFVCLFGSSRGSLLLFADNVVVLRIQQQERRSRRGCQCGLVRNRYVARSTRLRLDPEQERHESRTSFVDVAPQGRPQHLLTSEDAFVRCVTLGLCTCFVSSFSGLQCSIKNSLVSYLPPSLLFILALYLLWRFIVYKQIELSVMAPRGFNLTFFFSLTARLGFIELCENAYCALLLSVQRCGIVGFTDFWHSDASEVGCSLFWFWRMPVLTDCFVYLFIIIFSLAVRFGL